MRLFKVVLVLFFILITHNSFPITHSFAHSETKIVKMTPNGFDPQEVTIDVNSSVLFVNQDKVQRWPASNVHPTHDIYPEFDPKEPIEPGKDWVFKPKRAGTFKFHDHISPHFRGVLIVKGEDNIDVLDNSDLNILGKIKNTISAIISRAKNLFISFPPGFSKGQDENLDFTLISTKSPDEQFKLIEKMVQKNGVESTWDNFKEVYKDQGFLGLTSCSAEFAFGCFHGFLDTAFEKSLDDINKAQEACSRLGTGGPFASCIHGIGHGVASFHSTSNLKASLSSCRKLITGQEFCFDGVFME